MGSASVVLHYPETPGRLRMSRDVEVVPIGTPVLYYDGQIMERELGENSVFAEEHLFFVDYVTPDLLRCTPPGWQERVMIIELTPGLRGHCLDPPDVPYTSCGQADPRTSNGFMDCLARGSSHGQDWRNCTRATRSMQKRRSRWSARCRPCAISFLTPRRRLESRGHLSSSEANSTSLLTVFMFRPVPIFAAGMTSFEEP